MTSRAAATQGTSDASGFAPLRVPAFRTDVDDLAGRQLGDADAHRAGAAIVEENVFAVRQGGGATVHRLPGTVSRGRRVMRTLIAFH